MGKVGKVDKVGKAATLQRRRESLTWALHTYGDASWRKTTRRGQRHKALGPQKLTSMKMDDLAGSNPIYWSRVTHLCKLIEGDTEFTYWARQ